MKLDRRSFLRYLGLGAITFGTAAAVDVPGRRRALAGTVEPQPGTAAKHWAWTRFLPDESDEDIRRSIAVFRDAGVQALLIAGGDERGCRIARELGIEAHAWMWTLCRGDQSLMTEHPEWYAVSRNGVSTHTDPPYVGYYRFLCPSRAGVRRLLAQQVAQLAECDYLDGVHLDYVRYPDVILPVGLWEKYNLIQDKELPEFDFCYCEVCRRAFRELTGQDPLELPDPTADPRWRRYRFDTITRLVNELVDVVHARGKQITAAVFPTPTIARRLVRQDWPQWELDAVLPMLYHHFYEQPIAWIEASVAEGVNALPANRPLYAGLYLPALENDEDFDRAVQHALAGGAQGVALFGGVRRVPDGCDTGRR